MIFDSDDYENFDDLTEEEKIEFTIYYVLEKQNTKTKK